MKTLILFLLLLIISCKNNPVEPDKNLIEVVKRDLKTIDTVFPKELIDLFASKKIVLLGETHYVQEHQEFSAKMCDSLRKHGFNVLLTESIHGLSWMVEDFISWESDFLPDYVRFLDNYWIEEFRKMNKNLRPEDQFKLYFFDVNHGTNVFKTSITELERRIGAHQIFNQIKTAQFDSPSYVSELQKIENELKNNSNYNGIIWTSKIYNRILELVQVEIKSSEYRRESGTKKDVLRESAIIENIERQIENNKQSKILVNCGMWHAQKERMLGPENTPLGNYFSKKYGSSLLSIAFVGIKGERRANISDPTPIKFNLLTETSQANLANIIGKQAGESISSILLSDSIFNNEFEVSYTNNQKTNLRPARQYDLIITYPTISILKSLTTFKN